MTSLRHWLTVSKPLPTGRPQLAHHKGGQYYETLEIWSTFSVKKCHFHGRILKRQRHCFGIVQNNGIAQNNSIAKNNSIARNNWIVQNNGIVQNKNARVSGQCSEYVAFPDNVQKHGVSFFSASQSLLGQRTQDCRATIYVRLLYSKLPLSLRPMYSYLHHAYY